MNTLKILKIGGNVLHSSSQLHHILDAFAKWKGPKILVHGGGKYASALSQKLGITPQMIDGRRITDAPTLEVVTMVYAGQLNKKIVSQLQKRNCNAIGLSGADGNIIKAHKRAVSTIDYGFAGDIESVQSKQLLKLLHAGFTPVFCAITHDGQGQLLNTNADTISSALSVAMANHFTTELLYCFDKDGVLSDPKNEKSIINQINQKNYKEMVAEGIITDGMIPKLDNAFDALAQQVATVRIGSVYSLMTGNETIITAA